MLYSFRFFFRRGSTGFSLPSWCPSPALVLENTGSVARDHLASERTFLAYVRTSLAFSSAGVGTAVSSLNRRSHFLITCFTALVQLFTIASNIPNNKSMAVERAKFARPLGATVVIVGLGVLAVGACSSIFA